MEVVLAIAILSVAIAASAAGLSLAASARSGDKARSLAIEIANETLQKAEAFGCGLPVGYNGVSAAERLKACDYNGRNESGGNTFTYAGTGGTVSTIVSLSDVDFTTTREGIIFDVKVRIRWHTLHIPDSTYQSSDGDCKRRVNWANSDGTTVPDIPTQPTLLTRTITVTPGGASSVEVTSTEAVRTDLFQTGFGFVGFGFLSDTDSFTILTRQSLDTSNARVDDYHYVQHPDDNECVWYPYLEAPSTTNNVYYNVRYHDSSYKKIDYTFSSCVDSTTICHVYDARPT